MKDMNAVNWHASIAKEFDAKYSKSNQFKERYSVWKDAIDKYSGLTKHVIDAGCGSGVFSVYSSSLNGSVLGLDGSKVMVDLCKEKISKIGNENVSFLVSDFYEMPNLIDRKSDLTICSSVVEYTTDIEKSIDTLNSMTKSGGIVLISMPNKSSIYRKLEKLFFRFTGKPEYYRFVRHIVTIEEMGALLSRHGMEILENTFYAKIPVLSTLFGAVGLSKYSDGLFLVVARCA